MYNKVLEPLLDYNPKKTITPLGITVRRWMYPAIRKIIPHTVKRRLIQLNDPPKIKEPTIFVSTHEFREDAEAAYLAAGVPLYIVNGSVSIVMHSFDGITNWIAGMILLDRSDKQSRSSAKEKMVYALQSGANILVYPEGTWNKSPNQIISGLFPGVYEVAKRTGAKIVPIANHRTEDAVYSLVGGVTDIGTMPQDEAMECIKESLSTLRFLLMERLESARRKDFPIGKTLDEMWKAHVDSLMAEVAFYDYELEKHTKFREKGVVFPKEVFAFFDRIQPRPETAFLYRGNERWWRNNSCDI